MPIELGVLDTDSMRTAVDEFTLAVRRIDVLRHVLPVDGGLTVQRRLTGS